MFYDEEGMFFLSALPSHAYFMYKRLSHTSPAFPPPPLLLLHAKKSSPYFTD